MTCFLQQLLPAILAGVYGAFVQDSIPQRIQEHAIYIVTLIFHTLVYSDALRCADGISVIFLCQISLLSVSMKKIAIGRYLARMFYDLLYVLRESKKQDSKLLSISSPNIDRFSKFFHCCTRQEICNQTICYRSHHISKTPLRATL